MEDLNPVHVAATLLLLQQRRGEMSLRRGVLSTPRLRFRLTVRHRPESQNSPQTGNPLQAAFSHTETDCCCMKVLTIITRIAIRLLLLPLLALVLPLMFAWAWMKEATSARAPRSRSSLIGW